LLDVVQNAVERVLRDCREKIERRPGTGDVHSPALCTSRTRSSASAVLPPAPQVLGGRLP
jgi:hypothetical protein